MEPSQDVINTDPHYLHLSYIHLWTISHCLCVQTFDDLKMKKTIAILGATGTQGASVVDAFRTSPDWHIRALTRNPTSAKADAIPSSERITVVKADLNDWFSLFFTGIEIVSEMYSNDLPLLALQYNTYIFSLLFSHATHSGFPPATSSCQPGHLYLSAS